MMIETERLQLLPLTARQLNLWLYDLRALEAELEVSYEAEPLDGIFRDIVAGQYEKTAADEAHGVYHTFWFLIRRADRVIVGSADFKDVPDETGAVEIGYGLGKAHEHKGYMTEAVRAMCRWALDQEEVLSVVAETEADGLASQRILRRCGFKEWRREEKENLWWRLEG